VLELREVGPLRVEVGGVLAVEGAVGLDRDPFTTSVKDLLAIETREWAARRDGERWRLAMVGLGASRVGTVAGLSAFRSGARQSFGLPFRAVRARNRRPPWRDNSGVTRLFSVPRVLRALNPLSRCFSPVDEEERPRTPAPSPRPRSASIFDTHSECQRAVGMGVDRRLPHPATARDPLLGAPPRGIYDAHCNGLRPNRVVVDSPRDSKPLSHNAHPVLGGDSIYRGR
jgi:hypothetical protein